MFVGGFLGYVGVGGIGVVVGGGGHLGGKRTFLLLSNLNRKSMELSPSASTIPLFA